MDLGIFSGETFVVVGPLLGLALLIGMRIGGASRRALLEEQQGLHDKLAQVERRSGAHSDKTIVKMRREQDAVANLALALPSVVRDLNRDDVDPADVPRLILTLAHAIFEPRQILLYGLKTTQGDDAGPMLQLAAHRGMDQVPESLKTVQMGEGKIGWVAQHELDMLEEDWNSLRRSERVDVPNNHSALLPDIVGPLMHHAQEGPRVLGVLCIGGPRIQPRNVKLMFQMVTNFGSLGLVNSWNMRKLRSAAHRDGLTGLLNKRCFLGDVGTKALVACERESKRFSVFMFDIDHFKTFNDTNGHPAGDALLRRMGELIREHLRPGDLACRYGGEEFLIAMPDTDRWSAVGLAEQLRRRIETEPFEHRENQPTGLVSISGGIATFPGDGLSVSQLIQRADEALYSSKKGGRNRVTPYKGVEIGNVVELPAAVDGLDDPLDPISSVPRR